MTGNTLLLLQINRDKGLMPGDVTGPSEECTTDGLQNGLAVKLPSKYLCLYLQANAALNLCQRSFQ